MELEEIENEIKVTVPLITEEDIRKINNDFDGIVDRFSKMIIKEKDLAIAQYIIKEQQEQINELKRNSIPKKKIEDKIKELENCKMDIVQSPAHNVNEKMKMLDKNIIKREVLQELLEDK